MRRGHDPRLRVDGPRGGGNAGRDINEAIGDTLKATTGGGARHHVHADP